MTKNPIVATFNTNINKLQLSSSPNPNNGGDGTIRKNLLKMLPKRRDLLNLLTMLPKRRDLLKLVGGIVVVTPLALEGYAISSPKPQTNIDAIPLPQITNGGDVYTIVFHGANGPDANTDALIDALALADGNNNGRDRVKMVASKIHVIGISVGAFAADSFAQSLKRKEVGTDVENYVQLTLLDPFSLKGALGIGYGDREFGKAVDYAQQYLNTDDPVPSTNRPLQKCATIDVTSLRPPEIFGHDWPLVYYTQWLTASSSSRNNNADRQSSSWVIIPREEQREKGSVEVL